MALPLFPATALAGTGGAQSDSIATASRQNVDLSDVNLISYQPNHYPGDDVNFFIELYTLYWGQEYNSVNPPPWDVNYLFNLNVSFETVLDQNMMVVANPPITWVRKSVDTNNNMGWKFDSPYVYRYLYNDNNNGTYLRFTVNGENIKTGNYYLRFKVTAKVVTDYDAGPPEVYTFQTETSYRNIPLNILPGFIFNDVRAWSDYRQDWESLYAGASREKLRVDIIQNIPSSIINIHGMLDIKDNRITPLSKEAIEDQDNWYGLIWTVDVAKGTPAGRYQCELLLSYTRDDNPDIHVSETVPIYFNITVDWTPLLNFPDSQGYTKVLAKFIQHTPKANFTIPIKNDGNVKLESCSVEVYLDSAAYFKNGEFYYNELYGGNAYNKKMTYDLGTVNIGETKNAVFSDIMLKQYLPPGQYVIPLRYVCSYFDSGVIGSSDYRMAGYSDGYNQYETIHQASDYPEKPAPIYPFIFVEIADDSHGIEVDGYFSSIYQSNSRNTYFYLYVTNHEFYSFSQVTYTIHTDGGSPIKRVGVPDNDATTTMLPIRRSWLYADWTDTLGFYGDTKQYVPAGTSYVQVDVEATDPHNRKVSFSFDAPIVMYANTPTFELLKWSAEIGPNQTAKVTVTIQNVGWGNAKNLSCFFRSSSSSLLMIDTPVLIGKIVPGQIFNYTFTVKPTNDMTALYGSWAGYVYYEYTDDGGGVRKMFNAGSTYVNYILQPKLPSLQIINVVAPGVNPGSKLDVVLTIANFGGSTAYGVKIIWYDTQALFSIDGTNPSSFELNDLAPGQTTTVTFKVKASKACLPSSTYYVYPYFSYKRVDGYGMPFSEGGSRTFSLHTNPGAVPSQQVVKNEASGYTFDVGYMMLGILIVIAVAVGVSMYKKPPAATRYEAAVAEPVKPASPK